MSPCIPKNGQRTQKVTHKGSTSTHRSTIEYSLPLPGSPVHPPPPAKHSCVHSPRDNAVHSSAPDRPYSAHWYHNTHGISQYFFNTLYLQVFSNGFSDPSTLCLHPAHVNAILLMGIQAVSLLLLPQKASLHSYYSAMLAV